eukprot:5947982-Pyramimonas_sp.AAC.3
MVEFASAVGGHFYATAVGGHFYAHAVCGHFSGNAVGGHLWRPHGIATCSSSAVQGIGASDDNAPEEHIA